MNGLSNFYDAFLDAVVAARPRALHEFLVDRAVAGNAIVYRNTVFRGSADALSSAFPAVARLAGSAYFESVAVAYVNAHPPFARSLVGYGADLADFIDAAPGIEEAPYLADAARLDRAWLDAHRAPSRVPLLPQALAAVPPERLPDLRLRLHPSARLVNLKWELHEAWKNNRVETGSPLAFEVFKQDQAVLVWRPEHEVETQVLSASERWFFERLALGGTLGEAASEALQVCADFHTSVVFAGALEAGVFDSQQPHLDEKREEWW